MASTAFEIEMQMQPVVSELHRFLASCVKTTEGEKEAPSFMLVRSAAPHKSGLKYFGQSKVEDVAVEVGKVNVQKRVRFKEPETSGNRLPQIPHRQNKAPDLQAEAKDQMSQMRIAISGQTTIANQQIEETDNHMPRHRQQLRIDILSQLRTQYDDLAEGGQTTPRITHDDMYKTSSPACPSLPSSSGDSKPSPDIETSTTSENGASSIAAPEQMLTYPFMSDELHGGDCTPPPSHMLAYTFFDR
jgi:hypothetical protein